MDDAAEFVNGGILENPRIIRKLRSGSKSSSFLAVDKEGNRFMLTYLNRDRMFERLRFRAHLDGIPVEELDAEANKHLSLYEDEFKKTVERTKGLGDEHVAVTHGIGFDSEKNDFVVVSEYVPGVDFYYATRGLTPLQMIIFFTQACSGLAFIHRSGFLHLNIKPSVLRVDLEGAEPRDMFTDFGFARPLDDRSGEYPGTPLYMAPEVILNQRELIDRRADLYSMGILMYYCLTERHPTEPRVDAGHDRRRLMSIAEYESQFSPPSHFNKLMPPKLDDIVLGCLAKDPRQRMFGSASDLVNAFCEGWPNESRAMPHENTSTIEF